MESAKPTTLLVAALGGEGGHVLASWLHDAAIASGHYVQGTFIPGVAQRTGATTYYLEIVPGAAARHGAAAGRPVLALNAAPGEVDVVVASELLEAVRAVQAGFVTPDRTTLIASSTRVFTIDEKSAMTDGRRDAAHLEAVARRFSRRAVVADYGAVAAQSGSLVNAVLLGAIAAAGVLPIPAEACRQAIRRQGKSVDANLCGFEAGLTADGEPRAAAVPARPSPSGKDLGLSDLPAEAHAVLAAAVNRLADYQDAAHARRYLDRVQSFAGLPGADGAFVRELARQLALRMSVEDVIRVAQLKLRAERLERTGREAKAGRADIVDVTEFLKPGPEEIFGLLPPRLGRWALGRAGSGRSWPLKVRTTRFSGYARLKALASLRRWRPRTLKFQEEEAWVERWLALVRRTLAADPAAAREVVAAATLVRGYGDTYRRGRANWETIVGEILEPGLSGRLPGIALADALLQARLAAVKDPEGQALANTLAAIRRSAIARKAAAE